MDNKKYNDGKFDNDVKKVQDMIGDIMYSSYNRGYSEGLKAARKLDTLNENHNDSEYKKSDEDLCDGNCLKCKHKYNSDGCKAIKHSKKKHIEKMVIKDTEASDEREFDSEYDVSSEDIEDFLEFLDLLCMLDSANVSVKVLV